MVNRGAVPSHVRWYGVSTRIGAAFLAALVMASLIGFAVAGAAASAPFRPERQTSAQGAISVNAVSFEVSFRADQVAAGSVVVSNTAVAPGSIRAPERLSLAGVGMPAVDRGLAQGDSAARAVGSFGARAPAGTAIGKLITAADVNGPVASPRFFGRLASEAADPNIAEPAGDVKVSIASAPSDLSDGQKNRKMTVLIQNPTAHLLQDVELLGINSSDITVGPINGTKSCADPGEYSIGCIDEVESGASILLAVDLSVDGAIATGKQSVGIVAVGQFVLPGAARPTSATATTTIDLAVFGVTVVSPFGASAVFFLPAIVAFVAFVFASRLVYPRTGWLPPKAHASDPTLLTWLLPGAGLFYILAYAIFDTDLTEEMNTARVAWLFVAGFASGWFIWLIYALHYQIRIGRKLFKADDSPKKVLERLAGNKALLRRPQLDRSGMPTAILGKGAGDTIATSPLIVASFTGDGDPSADFLAVVQTGDARRVLASLSDQITLRWADVGIVLVPAASLPNTLSEPIMLIKEQ